jgi:hypothetical protein
VEVFVARDKNEAINSYLTDMLALEDHIEKAIRGQLTDLRTLSERRNAGGVAESVKRAGSAVAGMAAGLIDLVRSEGLPKNLRDDFTAFNLANVGYAMLQTTALALEDQEVADLARQHYRDYADAVMQFNNLIPAAVVRYLQQEGLPARESAVEQVNRDIEDAWQETADSPANEPVSARQI